MKWCRILGFVAMAGLYFGVPNARPDFTRFNCNDSECYLALAWNLASGRGYTRSFVDDIYIPHTTWPPGTSALMLPAVLLSGDTINWLAAKWTMCLVGLTGVGFAWLYVRTVTGNPRVADAAALLIGPNPLYWDFSHQAMAEIPLTGWVMGGLYLVDRVWAGRQVRSYEAMAVGLICGVSMMFKGHAGGLMFAPLAYLWGERRTTSGGRSGALTWLIFAAAFAVPQLSWMARNHTVPATGFEGINRFRSILAVNPNDPISPLVTGPEFATRVVQNVRYHAIYRLAEQMIPGLWADGVWRWRGSAICASTLAFALMLLVVPRRPGAITPFLVAAPMVLLNLAYGFGGSPRFWLPITSLLTMVAVINLGSVVIRLPRTWAVFVACGLVVNLSLYIMFHEAYPYNRVGNWRELANLFQLANRRADLRASNVLTQNQDAFQLMSGLNSPWGKEELYYDHVVLDTKRSVLPSQSKVVVSSAPWVIVALSRPMTQDQIARAIMKEE